MPLLSDYGEARIGDMHNGLIQADIYGAPEVILRMSWTSKVDMRYVGVLVCELSHDRSGTYLKTTIYSMVETPMGIIQMHIFSLKW